MQITYTGHQIDITEALKTFTSDKFSRLKRHFDRISSINITFDVEKLRNIAKATIHVPGKAIHATSESTTDMYSAIDNLVDKLDRQLKEHKNKVDNHS